MDLGLNFDGDQVTPESFLYHYQAKFLVQASVYPAKQLMNQIHLYSAPSNRHLYLLAEVYLASEFNQMLILAWYLESFYYKRHSLSNYSNYYMLILN